MPGDGAGLSRREFLAAANAAALLLLLESCNVGPLARSVSSPSIPAGASPQEKALKLLLGAVRASPDHFAQRSSDLISGKNADKIVQFVRDSFTALPVQFAGDDPESAVRWGSAATVRGGQGTFRERANVLADMLTQAGFKAQVMTAKRPSSLGLSDLYRARSVAFAPDQADLDAAKSLLAQAGVSPAASPQALNLASDPATTILGTLPQAIQKAKVRNDLLPDRLPLVQYTDGGKTKYAFALGSLDPTESAPAGLQPAIDADATRKVTITVSGLTNSALGARTERGKVVDLVKGTWAADQLVGNQVLLTFMPPQGSKAVLESGLSRLPVRIPTLRVQTKAAATAGDASLVATGNFVTVQGDVLGPSTTQSSGGDQQLQGPYGPLTQLSASDRAAAIAKAAAIQVSANASAFPEIEVEVAVADGSGNVIDGLDAPSFALSEQGSAVDSFTLYSNVKVQPRPRVLIACDNVTAETWTTTNGQATFEAAFDAAIAAAAAKKPFDIQFVRFGTAPTGDAWAAPQAGALVPLMNAAIESADDPWLTVGGPVLDQGVVAIVVISDMNALDTDKAQLPAYQRRLAAAHVPVFVIPTAGADQATANQVVSLSGGALLDPTDPGTPAKLESLLVPLVSSWIGGGYRIRYTAATSGPNERTVTVNLSGRNQPAGSAKYLVPQQPTPPPSFSGLYVTIDYGLASVVRRIAGLPARGRGIPGNAVDDPAAVAETRAALNGVTTIAFEPGTPTAAALLDEVLTSLLSIEPLRPIWPSATPDSILKAVPNGVHRLPALFAPLLTNAGITTGALPELRVAILQERQTAAGMEQHLDVVPGLNSVIPVVTDPAAAFKAVVGTSVSASVAEAATLPDSALIRLNGHKLVAIASGDYNGTNSFLNSVPAEKKKAWTTVLASYDGMHFLVPVAGAADALWLIDPDTGNSIAALLDGTGGAILTASCPGPSGLDLASVLVSLLGLLCTFGLVTSPFFCIGLTVLSVGLMVVALFSQDFTATTPFGVLSTAFGAGSPAKAIGGRIGVASVILLLLAISLEC